MNSRDRAVGDRRWTRYGTERDSHRRSAEVVHDERKSTHPTSDPAVGTHESGDGQRADIHDRNSSRFTRTVALSNGVFGIAITLLVLSLTVPASTQATPLATALQDVIPNGIAFVLTVFVVALYWRNHNELFESFDGIDGRLFGGNVCYLALVALVPFPNELIGTFPGEPLAYAVFGVVLASLALVDTTMFVYAHRQGLIRDTITARTYRIDVFRGVITILVFAASIPLAIVFVEWTPLLWVSLLLVDLGLERVSE